MTCAKAQGFLAAHAIAVAAEHDARKAPLGRAAALALLDEVDDLYAARGARVVHVPLRPTRPDAAALGALVLGPTGNLRAPALRAGRTLLIGFDAATYARLLT
jgi:arsenate reductase-like glutaredoxin family protein